LEKKRKRPLRKFVKELDKKNYKDFVKLSTYSPGFSLYDVLKLPVDRLTRHIHYLKGVLLWTLPDHMDVEWINEWAVLCERILNVGNAARQSENSAKKQLEVLTAIANKIDINSKTLISPERSFVREGELKWLDTKTGKVKDSHCFLFNDIMLLCESKGKRSKYKPKARIELKGCRSKNISDNQSFGGQILENAWEIQTPSQFYVVFTNTEEEKEKLLKDLEKSIYALNNTNTLLKP